MYPGIQTTTLNIDYTNSQQTNISMSSHYHTFLHDKLCFQQSFLETEFKGIAHPLVIWTVDPSQFFLTVTGAELKYLLTEHRVHSGR